MATDASQQSLPAVIADYVHQTAPDAPTFENHDYTSDEGDYVDALQQPASITWFMYSKPTETRIVEMFETFLGSDWDQINNRRIDRLEEFAADIELAHDRTALTREKWRNFFHELQMVYDSQRTKTASMQAAPVKGNLLTSPEVDSEPDPAERSTVQKVMDWIKSPFTPAKPKPTSRAYPDLDPSTWPPLTMYSSPPRPDDDPATPNPELTIYSDDDLSTPDANDEKVDTPDANDQKVPEYVLDLATPNELSTASRVLPPGPSAARAIDRAHARRAAFEAQQAQQQQQQFRAKHIPAVLQTPTRTRTRASSDPAKKPRLAMSGTRQPFQLTSPQTPMLRLRGGTGRPFSPAQLAQIQNQFRIAATYPPVPAPTPIRVRYQARTMLPYTTFHQGRPVVHIPNMSIRDKHVSFIKGHRQSQPLAHVNPDHSDPIGKFATVEHSNDGRFRIVMKRNAPTKAINRLASLIWIQSHTHPDARLNMLIDGKEVFLGKVKQLGKRKIRELVARASREGATIIVISEETGGSLQSKFWRHPGMSAILSR